MEPQKNANTDLYSFLGLQFGVSIDSIRARIKIHHESGMITPVLESTYSQILNILDSQESKDLYDRSILESAIEDNNAALKVYKAQKMLFTDYYKVLGINSDASPRSIKLQFRDLSLKFHPDKGPSADLEIFQKVNDAHQILGNPQARPWYNIVYDSYYKARNFLLQDSEEPPLTRSKTPVEARKIHIKNYEGDYKTLKNATKVFGGVEKTTIFGNKIAIVTMRSVEGAKSVVENLHGKRVGKNLIRISPYKTKEEREKEKRAKMEQERILREQRFNEYDMSDIEVIWQSAA